MKGNPSFSPVFTRIFVSPRPTPLGRCLRNVVRAGIPDVEALCSGLRQHIVEQFDAAIELFDA